MLHTTKMIKSDPKFIKMLLLHQNKCCVLHDVALKNIEGSSTNAVTQLFYHLLPFSLQRKALVKNPIFLSFFVSFAQPNRLLPIFKSFLGFSLSLL